MDNDAMQQDFDQVLALVQEQMQDLSVMQQRRSVLTAKASAAGRSSPPISSRVVVIVSLRAIPEPPFVS